jgi:hypothetical protein
MVLLIDITELPDEQLHMQWLSEHEPVIVDVRLALIPPSVVQPVNKIHCVLSNETTN